jgi:hypothetical protein
MPVENDAQRLARFLLAKAENCFARGLPLLGEALLTEAIEIKGRMGMAAGRRRFRRAPV